MAENRPKTDPQISGQTASRYPAKQTEGDVTERARHGRRLRDPPTPRQSTPRCLGRPEIADFGDLGGPGDPKNHSRRWGASPPTFWNGFGAGPKSAIAGRPKNHVSDGHDHTINIYDRRRFPGPGGAFLRPRTKGFASRGPRNLRSGGTFPSPIESYLWAAAVTQRTPSGT